MLTKGAACLGKGAQGRLIWEFLLSMFSIKKYGITKPLNARRIQTTFLCYSIAISTLYVPLTFRKVKKSKRENFTSVTGFFFLVFPLFVMHHSKTLLCMQILYMQNDCSATGHLPFLVCGGIWAMGLQAIQTQNGPTSVLKMFSFWCFFSFCLDILGLASIVSLCRLGLLHACVAGCN